MKMTLMQHFSELRRRILWTAFVFVMAFAFGWIISDSVESFLSAPLLNVWDDAALLYSEITDGLMIQFSLATLVALIITVPVLLWNIWAYIAPGLHKNEKQFLIPIFLFSPLLFIMGAAFAFYILFPSIKGYLAFSVGLLKVFGLAFQLPLVLIGLNRIGVLSKQVAIKSRRYVIIGVFVLAAMLTPPDILSQILLALPMVLLFEISLFFMRD